MICDAVVWLSSRTISVFWYTGCDLTISICLHVSPGVLFSHLCICLLIHNYFNASPLREIAAYHVKVTQICFVKQHTRTEAGALFTSWKHLGDFSFILGIMWSQATPVKKLSQRYVGPLCYTESVLSTLSMSRTEKKEAPGNAFSQGHVVLPLWL